MVISMNVPATFVQAFWGILLVVVVWKALSFLKLLPAALYLILVHNLCHDWVEQHPVLCYGIFAFLVLSVKVSTGSVQIKKSARNQPCQPGSFQGQMEEWQHLSGGIKDS